MIDWKLNQKQEWYQDLPATENIRLDWQHQWNENPLEWSEKPYNHKEVIIKISKEATLGKR